jgi:heptosyltransferase-2
LEYDFKQCNRILVRGVNWVGDTILTYPTVQKLKRIFPRSHLAVLIPNHLIDLWKTFPYVDEIIPFNNKRGLSFFWEDFKLCRSLKKKHFDLAVILPSSFHSAFQMFLAQIPTRMGYIGKRRSFLLNHKIPRTQETSLIHRIYYYKKIVESLGKGESDFSPRIILMEENRRWAEETLNHLGVLNGKPLIGMNPGATYGMAKCWYPDRFRELGMRLSRKWKATLLLFGNENEKPVAKEIASSLGGEGVDFTGKTDLLQLAALLERCHLLVTNDTGTMHVATAMSTPVVALFGSTDHITTGPWGEGHVVVRKDVFCSPCLKRVCPTDHRCMKGITVEEVERTIDQKLLELNTLSNNQILRTQHQLNSNIQ